MTTQTHRLHHKSMDLEVLYHLEKTKIQFEAIAVKIEEVIQQQFRLSDIWINKQPAAYIKGFTSKIIVDNSPVQAEIKEGKLYLSSDSFATMAVNVRYQENKRSLQLSPNLKVDGLSLLLENEFDCSGFTIFDSETANPLTGSLTLQACGISDNALLELLINEDAVSIVDRENRNLSATENGLGMASLPFNNCSETVKLPFDDKGPTWCEVEPGLNLLGRCVTKKCAAYNQWVYVPKGFNTFYLNEVCVTAECPICTERLEEVTNCLFLDCIYSIEGILAGSTETFSLQKQIAPSGHGTSFVESMGNQSNIVDWKYLKVTTSRQSIISSYSCTLF